MGNIVAVQKRIARACERVGRSPEEVKLVAVTKTVPSALVEAAAKCGITDFGENRVQEGRAKAAQLPGIGRWHLIGSLQTNKVRQALASFDCIHSVDRPRLVEAIARHYSPQKPCKLFMQVNVSGEETKHGVSVEKAPELARQISAAGLPLTGLMTLAPFCDDPEDTRPVFRELRVLAQQLQDLDLPGVNLKHLSMGMSNDFEVAIEEGASMVRVGSAIFGPRSY